MNVMQLENTVYPPLKWVGGKRKIIEILYSSISNIHTPLHTMNHSLVEEQFISCFTAKDLSKMRI